MFNVGPPLFVLFPSLKMTLPSYIAYSHGHELYAERSSSVWGKWLEVSIQQVAATPR
jgi:hypothetical protein